MLSCRECGHLLEQGPCDPINCPGKGTRDVAVKDRWLEVRPSGPGAGAQPPVPAQIAVCDPTTGTAWDWDWQARRYRGDMAAAAWGAGAFAWIELTTQCNQTCRHCFMIDRLRQGHVPTDQLLAALAALEGLPVGRLVFSGGEPTMHPGFTQVLSAALRLGRPVTVLSNGSRRSADLLAALAHPLVRVEIPLLGWQQTHDRMTGVAGSFERALASLRAYRAAGVHVVLTTTLTHYAQEALPRLKDVAEQLGIAFEASRLFAQGAAVRNWEELLPRPVEAPGDDGVAPAQPVPA